MPRQTPRRHPPRTTRTSPTAVAHERLPPPHVGARPHQPEPATVLRLQNGGERLRRLGRGRVGVPRPDAERPRGRPSHAEGGGALGVPYGVGDELCREQLGDVDEGDEPVHGEDEPQGAATHGDGADVVGDVEGVLPGLTFGHAEVRSEVGELMAGTGVVAAAAMAGRSGALPGSGFARCVSRHRT